MLAHASSMNGRLAAHFLVQLFTMFPGWVFDVTNAGMFTLQIYLISSMIPKSNWKNLLIVAVFFALLRFEFAFGQVNLWQDGAINYLWSAVFALLFMKPMLRDYLANEQNTPGIIRQVLGLFGCFFMGAYSETASVAAIFFAGVLFLAQWYTGGGEKWNRWLLMQIVAAFLGYASIYLAPAQWDNKSVDGTVGDFIYNFLYAGRVYLNLWVLLLAFVALFYVSIKKKVDKKYIFLSAVFLASSFVSNFMLAFAAYYPERSAVGAFVFLLCANAILCQSLLEKAEFRLPMLAVTILLICCTVKPFYYGASDIFSTYQQMQNNILKIEQSRDSGIGDISLPMVSEKTTYNALYCSKYLDTENCNSWPNNHMARYYHVDSIIGIAGDG